MSDKLGSPRHYAKPYSSPLLHSLRNLTLPALVMLGTLAPAAQAVLLPGDNLVVDSSAGTDDRGALFAVKRKGGVRTLLSDFGNSQQGPVGMMPVAAVFESLNSVIAIDLNGGTDLRGAAYRIDTLTGTRTLLSDFGDSHFGPLGSNPSSIAIEATGDLLVVDPSAGDTDHRGRLFRIDANTGTRTVLSNFADVTQGPKGMTPGGVAVDADGKILVADANLMPGVAGMVFQIDPATGARSVVSDFGEASQGPVSSDPSTIAVESAGTWLVSDPGDRLNDIAGSLYRIDPITGMRVVVSDFNNPDQGPLGASPLGIAQQNTGKILIADADADIGTGSDARGALFAVDPATGMRKGLSDFGNADQGPLGNDPVAVVPVPGILLKHFKFNVKFDVAHRTLWVRGRFGVEGQSANIDMLKEVLRVRLGRFVEQLPLSACSLLGGKAVKCEGKLAGSTFALLLRPLGKQQFAFYLTASGLNTTQLRKAIPFSLALGERMGGGILKLISKP